MARSTTKRALIIGGGIGGLTAAAALRQAGIEVAVYERTAELREVGAGLILWPNAMQALGMLGGHGESPRLAEAVRSVSRASGGAALLTWRGERLLEAFPRKLLECEFGEPAAAVHRAELLGVLLRAAGAEIVHLGARCVGFRQEGTGVTARLEDGREIEGDLLIGADGLRSVVRGQLLGETQLRYAGYTAWRGVATFKLDQDTWFESWGRGARFGAGGLTRERVYWYATANVPKGAPDAPEGRRRELIERFREWHAPVPALLEATDESAILRTDLYDREPVKRWSEGRVTLLGDAAHPTTPNLGQGACMAIEDAVVLASCLRDHAEIPAALRAYERRRIPRTSAIVRQSRRVGGIGQWENPAACRLRDWFLKRTPARVRLRQLQWLCTFPF
jgi:2-polyprenyl-6-methoxyphenol hydroxylase-like FAD-dependent oxidoreductase